MSPSRFFTLGLYPFNRGVGWVAYDETMQLGGFGICSALENKHVRCLRRIIGLLERFKPQTVVLESFDLTSSKRHPRIERLCLEAITETKARQIEVTIYTRAEVQQCFAGVGSLTRQQIAEAVARHSTALRSKLPQRRKAWEGESRNMSIFNAAALVLTHFHFGTSRLSGLEPK